LDREVTQDGEVLAAHRHGRPGLAPRSPHALSHLTRGLLENAAFSTGDATHEIRAPTHCRPLGRQGSACDGPPIVQLADYLIIGYHCVGEEDLVEQASSRHL